MTGFRAIKRFTVDLDHGLHKFLKRWAMEEDADMSDVVRALIGLLRGDERLQAGVRTSLQQPGWAKGPSTSRKTKTS
jgi:hypothetical protein